MVYVTKYVSFELSAIFHNIYSLCLWQSIDFFFFLAFNFHFLCFKTCQGVVQKIVTLLENRMCLAGFFLDHNNLKIQPSRFLGMR